MGVRVLRRHLEVMRRRREWMTRIAETYLALWWLPAGELPTIGDARRRLDHLRTHGPTPDAFTSKRAASRRRRADGVRARPLDP